MRLQEAAKLLAQFHRGALTPRFASLEAAFRGTKRSRCASKCASEGIDPSLLEALLEVKRVAGQITVSIHAVGILLSLPKVLQPGETVVSLSLGAGNTGRQFDLVTDRSVAEFKFIRWRGGAESIRQNALFKDFYRLSEANTRKSKYLYVLGVEHPNHFLSSGRSLDSVMSRNNKLHKDFQTKYGNRFQVVREYYDYRRKTVAIVDLLRRVPILAKLQSRIGLKA